MRRFCLIVLFSVVFAFPSSAQDRAAVYTVSRSDVNRIICPGAVTDVIFSEEKGITSKVVGNDVFVKFPVTVSVDQETMEKRVLYGNNAAELFLVCGGVTYNTILKPADIPSQTIKIEPKEQEVNELKGKDTEEVLGVLIGFAVDGSFPKSFRMSEHNASYDIARNGGKLTVLYRRLWSGGGYNVREFHIYSGSEITLMPVELIGFPEVKKPLAVSLTAEKFKGWTRGFIIEAAK